MFDDSSREELIDVYFQGFTDELQTNSWKEYNNALQDRAYQLGRIDALVGDDVRSVDYQSEEHLLQRINNIPQ